MSETLLLHLQNLQHDLPSSVRAIDVQTVTGIELADGTNIRGMYRRKDTMEDTLALEWPVDKAEKVAEFYDKYLSTSHTSNDSWNCHKFVAEVMGWEVKWGKNALPYYMPRAIRKTNPLELEDKKPYAVVSLVKLRHSMIGLPDPTQNLSVWGYNDTLCVASNEATMASYGSSIHHHKTPPALGRYATRLLGVSTTFHPGV